MATLDLSNPLNMIHHELETVWMRRLITVRAYYILRRHGINTDDQFFDLWPTVDARQWTNFGIGCQKSCDNAYSYKALYLESKNNGTL